MRYLLFALLIVANALATTSVVVTGVTSKQAVVKIITTAPSSTTCAIRASEGTTLGTMIADVDTGLFAGSNLDNRDGAQQYATTRYFVLGGTVGFASGVTYSRALRENTTHIIGVTCSPDAEVTKVFRTNPIPAGTSYQIPPPINPTTHEIAWPTIDYADRSKAYIDPMTGASVYRVTGPGDMPADSTQGNVNFNYSVDFSSAWTSPDAAFNGVSSPASLASTSATGALFVGYKTIPAPGGNSSKGLLYNFAWDDVLPKFWGRGESATTADRQIDVCLSVDSGQTCYGNTVTFTLPQSLTTSGNATSTITNYPGPKFGVAPFAWVGTIPPKELIGGLSGTLTADPATATITSAASLSSTDGSNRFSMDWTPGTKIFIANSTCPSNLCTIDHVVDALNVVLTADPGITGAQAWNSANFGLRIAKKTSSGLIYLSSTLEHATSRNGRMIQDNGQFRVCGKNISVSVDRTGTALAAPKIGRLCAFSSDTGTAPVQSGLYLLLEDGETRMISPLFHGNIGSGSDLVAANRGGHAAGLGFADDGRTMYMMSTVAPPYVVVKAYYSGDYRDLAYVPGYTFAYSGSAVTDNIAWSIVTLPSTQNDLVGAALRLRPELGSSLINTTTGATGGLYYTRREIGYVPSLVAGHAGYYACALYNGQDRWTIIVFWDLQTGEAIKALDLHSGQYSSEMRWGVLHNGFATEAYTDSNNRYVRVTAQHFGPMLGFTSTVSHIDKGAGWSTALAVASTDGYTCPSDVIATWNLATIQRKCISFRFTGDPSRLPTSGNGYTSELNAWPCSWNAARSCPQQWAVGDMFTANSNGDYEKFRIASISRVSDTQIEVVAFRNAACGMFAYPTNTNLSTFGSVATVWPMATGGCASGIQMLADFNAGTGWQMDYGWNHHNIGFNEDGGVSIVASSSQSIVNYSGIEVRRDARSSPRFKGVNDYYFMTTLQFANGTGTTAAGSTTQSYPSKLQNLADSAPDRRMFTMDRRAINGLAGYSPEQPLATSQRITSATMTAVAGYSFSLVQKASFTGWTLDRKRLPLFGWSGRYDWVDLSSPTQHLTSATSTITDADVYSYCVASRSNECVNGSTTGSIYINPGPYSQTLTDCYGGVSMANYPCLIAPPSVAGWSMQMLDAKLTCSDTVGSLCPPYARVRRITMNFDGPGREYQYSNTRPVGSGEWAMFQRGFKERFRADIFRVKLPPWSLRDTIARDTYVPIPVRLGVRPGAVVVKFGYGEHGTASQYYCLTRKEACLARTAAVSESNPFAWEYEVTTQAVAGLSCTAGCTVVVPAIANRVLYYEAYDVAAGVLTAIPGTRGQVAIP